jgi:hypothetical protein
MHAGIEPERPLYARALRLRHLNPGSALCFFFLEGSIALGVVLWLAELVDGWGVVLLPLCVAAMVKINDFVAGAVARSAGNAVGQVERPRPPVRNKPPLRPVVGRASVPTNQVAEPGRVYRSDTSTWNAPTPSPNDPAVADRGTRTRAEFVDVADTPEQRARQAATRRYE